MFENGTKRGKIGHFHFTKKAFSEVVLNYISQILSPRKCKEKKGWVGFSWGFKISIKKNVQNYNDFFLTKKSFFTSQLCHISNVV